MNFLKENRIPILLCVGLLLFIAHYESQPLLKYVFLPQIGTAIILAVVLFLVFHRWRELKEIGLGPKSLWIPLAVTSGSAVLRLIIQQDLETLAGALWMACMFGLYVISRRYGEKALSFFVPAVVVGAISIVVQAVVTRGHANWGLFNNYATASEFLVFGWVVSPRKYRWWLAGVVLIGLFFTGAPEAIFYVAIMGLAVLARRDWSVKLAVPLGTLGLLMIACSLAGITQVLWQRSYDIMDDTYTALTDHSLTDEERALLLNEATDIRWLYTWRLQRPVAILGYGLDLTNRGALEGRHIPHFVGLLVTDQLGPIAASAWFAVVIAGMIVTRWKYMFLSLVLFGIFQPFVWTLMAPYMWVAAGAASGCEGESGYVFKEVTIGAT